MLASFKSVPALFTRQPGCHWWESKIIVPSSVDAVVLRLPECSLPTLSSALCWHLWSPAGLSFYFLFSFSKEVITREDTATKRAVAVGDNPSKRLFIEKTVYIIQSSWMIYQW